VHKTPRHIYAQVTDAQGAKVHRRRLHRARTVKEGLKYTGNVEAAKAVGRAIAESAKAAASRSVVRSCGFRYHGRVKALADAAREAGWSSKIYGKSRKSPSPPTSSPRSWSRSIARRRS
jgi:large subunit ribosomal protein L18